MRQSIKHILILTLIGITGPAIAAEEGGLRIAAVDLARLMEESPYTTDVGERLRQEFSPVQRELTAMQQELQAMEDRMTTQGEFLTEEEAVSLEREMGRLSRQLQLRGAEYQEDVGRRNNEEVLRLQNCRQDQHRDHQSAQHTNSWFWAMRVLARSNNS